MVRVKWQILENGRELLASGTQDAEGRDAYETAMRTAEAIERAMLALFPGSAVPAPEQLGIIQPGTVQ